MRAPKSMRGCRGKASVPSPFSRPACSHGTRRRRDTSFRASGDDQQTSSSDRKSEEPQASTEKAGQQQAGSEGGYESADDTRSMQIPRDVIKRMRDTVFGFDTFFVTGVENYEANGVLFQGNLRGDPAVAYEKMQRRCQNELGDGYRLYLLQDQKEKPVVVVLPAEAVEIKTTAAVPVLAAVFFVVTLATTLQANGVPLLVALIAQDPSFVTGQTLSDALPGTVSTLAIFGAHEAGHLVAARQQGAKLLPPFLIPAGLGIIGSFGAITPINSTLKRRAELLRIAEAGPAAGTAVSAALVLGGLALSVAKAGPLVQIQSDAFNDCILMGAIGQAVFGSTLQSYPTLFVSPFLMAGWAGLVINGLNLVPIGELDGGRILHGVWGRRAATRVGVVVTLVLGLAGFVDDLALYWLLLVIFLQRGPILPQQDEITAPEGAELSIALLTLPLLTLLPFPGDVTSAGF